jgi:hypothetical protein
MSDEGDLWRVAKPQMLEEKMKRHAQSRKAIGKLGSAN